MIRQISSDTSRIPARYANRSLLSLPSVRKVKIVQSLVSPIVRHFCRSSHDSESFFLRSSDWNIHIYPSVLIKSMFMSWNRFLCSMPWNRAYRFRSYPYNSVCFTYLLPALLPQLTRMLTTHDRQRKSVLFNCPCSVLSEQDSEVYNTSKKVCYYWHVHNEKLQQCAY
jgi:hypothetical protein